MSNNAIKRVHWKDVERDSGQMSPAERLNTQAIVPSHDVAKRRLSETDDPGERAMIKLARLAKCLESWAMISNDIWLLRMMRDAVDDDDTDFGEPDHDPAPEPEPAPAKARTKRKV